MKRLIVMAVVAAISGGLAISPASAATPAPVVKPESPTQATPQTRVDPCLVPKRDKKKPTEKSAAATAPVKK